MSRYEQEVVQINGRRRVTVRVLSVLGAACVATLALWSAGLPPEEWMCATKQWWGSSDAPPPAARDQVAIPQTPEEATVAPVRKTDDIAAEGTDSSLSATPLPLYLIATSPGRNKNDGTALIGTSLENPQTYAGGALLVNGARLAEVHKDHVLLTRGDSSAELYLYQRDPRADQRRSSSDLLTVSSTPAVPLVVDKMGEGLTDYVRPSPVYDGEILRGYQVYPGSHRGVFAQLGLEPGDVVTSINDAPLNEPLQSMELFAQLMRGVAVVATVDRKNISRRITLDGALIRADQERSKEVSAAPMPDLPSS
jgi:type II secretion system protein C